MNFQKWEAKIHIAIPIYQQAQKKLENENQDNLYNIPHSILKRSVFF